MSFRLGPTPRRIPFTIVSATPSPALSEAVFEPIQTCATYENKTHNIELLNNKAMLTFGVGHDIGKQNLRPSMWKLDLCEQDTNSWRYIYSFCGDGTEGRIKVSTGTSARS